jgi:peroxiredoxin (alkyl hydroperoxide reductase subunit C)
VNWKPGAKFIVPPPKTVKDMEEREKSNYEMVDFYLARTSV